MRQLNCIISDYPSKLKDADDITLRGYVQMPRVILYSGGISDGDKVVHLLLLSFAWQQPSCFPSQASLGDMRGKTVRQMRRNLKSLSDNGYINIIQNGSARANTYEILCRVAKGGRVINPVRGGETAAIDRQDADDFSIGGFTPVPVALLEDKELSDGAILTYALIADQGTGAPSQSEMAEARGISRPAFSVHVNELVKRGYLDVKKEGWGNTLTYTLRYKFKNKRPT